MSKVSVELLKQHASAVQSCIEDAEPYLINEYGEPLEIADELRNNWDLLYSEILDLHELLVDFTGEIEWLIY